MSRASWPPATTSVLTRASSSRTRFPVEQQWDPEEHHRVLATAFAAAEKAGVHGKAVTPFLLGFIVDASGGRSLEVNLDLARNNVRVAAEIAIAWSSLRPSARPSS
jgi:pseudouridylate synthase